MFMKVTTIDDLIQEGKAQQEALYEQAKLEEQDARREAEAYKQRLLAYVRDMLPTCLEDYLIYKGKTNVRIGFDYGYFKEVPFFEIHVPGQAPIQFHAVLVNGTDGLAGRLLKVQGEKMFSVLDYAVRFNDFDGEYYLAAIDRYTTDEITLALYWANVYGDTRAQAELMLEEAIEGGPPPEPTEPKETKTPEGLIAEAIRMMITGEPGYAE